MKDIFKTDKGKYVSPSPIEMRLLKNTDIEQVCVVGMGIPQPIALIILSSSGKSKRKEEITKSLSASLAEVNDTVEDYERLKKAVIMKTDWSIANGLMTPTVKVSATRWRNPFTKISNLVCSRRTRSLGVTRIFLKMTILQEKINEK